MNQPTADPLETDPLEPSSEVTYTPPAVVVIQYRNRGIPWYLLMPMVLLLSAGAAAVYHRLYIMNSRLDSEGRPATSGMDSSAPLSPTGSRDAGAKLPEADPIFPNIPVTSLPSPLSLNSQPMSPGSIDLFPSTNRIEPFLVPPGFSSLPGHSPTVEQTPRSTAATPPIALDPAIPATAIPGPAGVAPTGPHETPKSPVAVGFLPPGSSMSEPRHDPERATPDPTQAIVPPQPEPPFADAGPFTPANDPTLPAPSKEELERQLQDEARQRLAEIKNLNRKKERAQQNSQLESRTRVDHERADFRRELRQILKEGGKDMGQDIDALCNQFGRDYNAELRERVTHVLSRVHGRMSREAKVRLLRELGVPEPGILDFLANEFHRFINTRNGPRDPNQVRVTAATLLLKFKLPESAAPAGGLETAPPPSPRLPVTAGGPGIPGPSSPQ